MLDAKITVTNMSKASTALSKLRQAGKDNRGLFRAVEPVVEKIFKQRFAQGGPGWRRHSPATLIIHKPHRKLILTGKLLRSLTKKGSRGSYRRITKSRYEHGTKVKSPQGVEYAKFVDKGTRQSVSPLQSSWFRAHRLFVPVGARLINPARPFLYLTGKDENAIRRAGEAYMKSQNSGFAA